MIPRCTTLTHGGVPLVVGYGCGREKRSRCWRCETEGMAPVGIPSLFRRVVPLYSRGWDVPSRSPHDLVVETPSR